MEDYYKKYIASLMREHADEIKEYKYSITIAEEEIEELETKLEVLESNTEEYHITMDKYREQVDEDMAET